MKMHLVYLVAVHYYLSPQCTWFEKHGSSPVDVSISANIIEHYVIGPRGPRNSARWRKYINKCDAVGSLLLWDIEEACWGKRRNRSLLFGSLGKTLEIGFPS